MAQITVSPRLVRAAQQLLQESPDYLVDMGILMHILCTRRFNNGQGKWWTDVPIRWLATQSHMGVLRVTKALARLEDMGFIIPSTGNATAAIRRTPRRYKLMPDMDN